MLKRAIQTLWIALEELDPMWIPVHHSWRLNERHYGALQGLNKAETAAKFGEAQVLDLAPQLRHAAARARARRSRASRRAIRATRRSARRAAAAPNASRTPWRAFCPTGTRRSRRRSEPASACIVAAHGNCMRALIKYLDNVCDADIVGLNIPTGVPLVYELDDDLKPLRHYYLGDAAEAEARAQAVANQGKAKA